MSITREDLEYSGIEILRLDGTPETTELFEEEFYTTSIGRQIRSQGLETKSNIKVILSLARESTGRRDISLKEFETAAKQLFLNGDLQPEQELAAPREPDVERDRLGRPLSPKAKQWKRWQEWCNDPNTKMAEIQSLRRTNSEFAEFFANQSAQERAGGVGDAVEAAGTQAVRQDESIRRTGDLRAFAAAYRRTSTAEVKRMSSPATNPLGHQQYTDLLDACIASGLI
jgi:hypothetical protein